MLKENLPPLPRPDADKASWIKDSRSSVQETSGAWRRKETILSNCRLGIFVLAATGFCAWHGTPVLALASLVVGFVLFFLARRFHRRTAEQVKILDLLTTVLDESGHRLGGRLAVIRSGARPEGDPGKPPARTWPLLPQEVEDLDLFAEPVGLFGLLNRTSTHLGAKRLALDLCNPSLDADAILDRQAAVAWLRDRPDRRLLLMAAAAGLRGQDAGLELFRDTVRSIQPLPRLASHFLVRAWSLVLLAAGVVVIALYPGMWLLVLFLIILLNTPLLVVLRKDLLERIRPWLRLDVVTRYLALLSETAASILPREGHLDALRIAFERASRRPALPALARTIPFLFLGFSGMTHKFVNALTLWDVHWLRALERSYLNHREEILSATEALTELEVLLSLAAFAWEEPLTCMPEIQTGSEVLRIRSSRHPLISPEDVVANDLDLDLPMRVWIITGSNMSGKSTFLRTAGVCILLAQVGCVVPAEAMTLTPSALLTDLRIRDDLGRHESYFLAEVRQVKRILDHSRTGHPLVGLLDEPFRGTNSEERLASATAVIEALIRGGGHFLVATHDRQVSTLADGKVVSNHHFQETLEEDALSFDFKIRSGPATMRNAIKVLRAEGYPDEVVETAERIVRELDAGSGS